jgi:hypothetical protein
MRPGTQKTTVSWSFGIESYGYLDLGTLDRWLWSQCNRDGWGLTWMER